MKKRILLIGLAQSSHTQSWLDLIDKKKFEVRIFGIGNSCPNSPANQFYYRFQENFPFINISPSQNKFWQNLRKIFFYLDSRWQSRFEKNWLALIIKNWKPDIIHTLGVEISTEFFWEVREKIKISKNFQWVVTIRGGSDIELARFNKVRQDFFRKIFEKCDFVFADNLVSYKYAFRLGLKKSQLPPWAFVPGTGGIDIEKLAAGRKTKTTKSRMILWPKACEATYSKGLPVLEALKLAWPQIKPCKIIMTVTNQDFENWLNALPQDILDNIETYDRIPRADLLKKMANSRILLIPSLVDGIPNSLYEAMACKTLPIVSPLGTIKTIVTKENVLFARNLYPEEIAQALIKGMNDNKLVDKIISNNIPLVYKIANRETIGQRVNKFYQEIA